MYFYEISMICLSAVTCTFIYSYGKVVFAREHRMFNTDFTAIHEAINKLHDRVIKLEKRTNILN